MSHPRTQVWRCRRYRALLGLEQESRLQVATVTGLVVTPTHVGTACPSCGHPNRAKRGRGMPHPSGDRHVDLPQTGDCDVSLGLCVLPAADVPAEQPQGFASVGGAAAWPAWPLLSHFRASQPLHW